MNSDPAIRAAIERRATHLAPPQAVGVEHIEATAARRRRRSMISGALATVVLAAVVSLGIGAAVGSTPDDGVFATEITDGTFADANLVPWKVIFDGDRYVALASDGEFRWDEPASQRFAVATSISGEAWRRVDESPVFEARDAVLTAHDGTYMVAWVPHGDAAGETDQSESPELVLSTSHDLVDWDERDRALESESGPDGTRLQPVAMVAADAGVMIQAQYVPSPFPQLDDELEALGYDIETLCETGWSSTTATLRECGTTERVRVKVETDFAVGFPFEQRLLFAGPDAPLETVSPPTDDYWRPRAGRPLLYPTSMGFGIHGPDPYESDDGLNWTLVPTRGEQSAMVAVRGADRVFRSMSPASRLGTDSPVWGTGFQAGDGEWIEIDLEALYEQSPDKPQLFSDLQAGPAGWTLLAQRSFMTRPEVAGVERGRTGASEFTLTANSGHVLTGTVPFGPATLVDPDGVVLHEWEQFEVTNPEWSGLEVSLAGVVWRSATTERIAVTFTPRQWSALLDPLGLLEFDVLFSPDGRTWEILETYDLGWPSVLAIGDDEVLVRESIGLPNLTASVTHVIPLDPSG